MKILDAKVEPKLRYTGLGACKYYICFDIRFKVKLWVKYVVERRTYTDRVHIHALGRPAGRTGESILKQCAGCSFVNSTEIPRIVTIEDSNPSDEDVIKETTVDVKGQLEVLCGVNESQEVSFDIIFKPEYVPVEAKLTVKAYLNAEEATLENIRLEGVEGVAEAKPKINEYYVTPTKIEEGDSIDVIAVIQNVGDATGTFKIYTKVNDEIVEDSEVTTELSKYEETVYMVSITMPSAGTYDVIVCVEVI